MVDAVGPALVLKLGGSLTETRRLTAIADIVARASYPTVIVPGGGILADSVRSAQRELQVSDSLAHRLALLSLNQMAFVISARHPRFELAASLRDIADILVEGAIPVWLPFELQASDDTLPADWTTTSDALAARLAERMGCGQVALVKSCPIPADATLAWATTEGVTDPMFQAVVQRAGLRWALYGPGDEANLAERLGSTADV
jgi:aspartokinase-like uncharacterized kinase